MLSTQDDKQPSVLSAGRSFGFGLELISTPVRADCDGTRPHLWRQQFSVRLLFMLDVKHQAFSRLFALRNDGEKMWWKDPIWVVTKATGFFEFRGTTFVIRILQLNCYWWTLNIYRVSCENGNHQLDQPENDTTTSAIWRGTTQADSPSISTHQQWWSTKLFAIMKGDTIRRDSRHRFFALWFPKRNSLQLVLYEALFLHNMSS